MKKIYMDHVATNPLHPEVLDAMMPYFKEEYGNPLSLYPPGFNARKVIESSRESTAALINAKPKEIILGHMDIKDLIQVKKFITPCGIQIKLGSSHMNLFE